MPTTNRKVSGKTKYLCHHEHYDVSDYTPRESQCINLSALPDDDFITLILEVLFLIYAVKSLIRTDNAKYSPSSNIFVTQQYLQYEFVLLISQKYEIMNICV